MCRDKIKARDKKTGEKKLVPVKPKLVRFPHATDTSKANLYARIGTRKPINDAHLYGHEMDAADCFVAVKKALGLDLAAWYKPSLDKKWQTEIARPFGVRPDRVLEIENKPIIFAVEVDRGSEEDVWRQVWPKLENYVRLSRASRGQRMHVLFTTQAYRYDREARERLEKLLPLFARAKAGRQFLITTHDDFLANPLGSIFETDTEKGISILDL